MSVNFTVAIPTHNGASRLPLVLERLRDEVDTAEIAWEIIVVDHNSTDETATLVRQYRTAWQKPYPLRYCLETQQGAAFARKRGVSQSNGSLIGFLDDGELELFIKSLISPLYLGQNGDLTGAGKVKRLKTETP